MHFEKFANFFRWVNQHIYCAHKQYVRRPLNDSLTFYTYECNRCGKRKKDWQERIKKRKGSKNEWFEEKE